MRLIVTAVISLELGALPACKDFDLGATTTAKSKSEATGSDEVIIKPGAAKSGKSKKPMDNDGEEPVSEKKPPKCTSISGTYSASRSRSKTKPGSCEEGSAATKFSSSIPIKITAEGAGFVVDVGYSTPDGELKYARCTSNVAGCVVFATCEPNAGTDQLTFTIDGESLSGTIERVTSETKCTINFDVKGNRK